MLTMIPLCYHFGKYVMIHVHDVIITQICRCYNHFIRQYIDLGDNIHVHEHIHGWPLDHSHYRRHRHFHYHQIDYSIHHSFY